MVDCTHDQSAPVYVKPDGRTTCCGAYTTFFIDTGEEYCKCCYRTVVGHLQEA